jgi:hypothetical protein
VRRTTIKSRDELDARLRNEAERRGVTISELTRAALEAYLQAPAPGARRRVLSSAAGDSGRGDVSERIEEILADEFGRCC